MKTHYDNLQVARNASPEVIKGAYKYLAQKWHPDKNFGNNAVAERNLKLINRAYEVLSDPHLRKEHDDWIARQEGDDDAPKKRKESPQSETTEDDTSSVSRVSEATLASSENEYIDALKKYAVFKGRATRKQYWIFLFYNVLISFGLGFVEGLMEYTDEVLSNIYSLALLIPSLSVGVRRMHDTNRSGWWYLVPIVNLVFACQKSKEPISTEYSTTPAVAVVAVVFGGAAILGAIALPAYQDYTVRAKISEALAALAEAKTIIAQYLLANGELPVDSRSFGINHYESDIVASLSIADYVRDDTIRIVANVRSCTWDGGPCNDTDFRSFHLAGSVNADGTMSWMCQPGDANGANAIETKYLPANCRAKVIESNHSEQRAATDGSSRVSTKKLSESDIHSAAKEVADQYNRDFSKTPTAPVIKSVARADRRQVRVMNLVKFNREFSQPELREFRDEMQSQMLQKVCSNFKYSPAFQSGMYLTYVWESDLGQRLAETKISMSTCKGFSVGAASADSSGDPSVAENVQPVAAQAEAPNPLSLNSDTMRWAGNDSHWAVVESVNNKLNADPAWMDKSIEQRIPEIVRRTKLAIGEQSDTDVTASSDTHRAATTQRTQHDYSVVNAESSVFVESPIPFTGSAPKTWVRVPPATGNSQLKFVSPSGTPQAECAVIVKIAQSGSGISQADINALLLETPDGESMAKELSVNFNDVRVLAAGNGALSGVPAHIYNVQYSVGSPIGKLWVRGIYSTTITSPGTTWTISCGGQGETLTEAQRAYDYWHLEIVKFPTFINIHD